MAWFKKKKGDLGPNPQYYDKRPSDKPALTQGESRQRYRSDPASQASASALRYPEIVTSGFWEDEAHTFHLSYGFRQQPDIGGALNYAYENYGLPLQDICGGFMVAKFPIPPIGSRPLAFYQTAPVTSIGGLIPGQVISQPLLNPYDAGSGFDIYD